MSLYDEFTSKENLEIAYLYLKEEIDTSTLPLDPILKPAMNAVVELGTDFFEALSKFLRAGHYNPGKADYIYAQKDNLGLRPICVISVIDKIIYQALLNPSVLGNIIDKKLLSFCYGNRVLGKKVFYYPYKNQWSRFIDHQIKAYESDYKWRVEVDIKTFFEDIHVGTLIKRLKENFTITDQKILDLLANQLNTWSENQETNLGIPQGLNVSHVLANAYLHPLDTFMNNLMSDKNFKYFRYVDDIVIMAKSADVVNQIVEKALLFLRKYNLDLNEKTKLEKLQNTTNLEEIKFYNPYGIINDTSRQKVEKIRKLLPKILKKIKKGDELKKVEISSLRYFLKAASDGENFGITDDLIDIIPLKPSLINLIAKYLWFYISGFFAENRTSLSLYERIWKIYQGNSLTDGTKFWLLKTLAIPKYASKHTGFQEELDRILADRDAKFLKIIALSYKAYVQEHLDVMAQLGFTNDDLKRFISNAVTDAEKAVYYYFSIYLKTDEPEISAEIVLEALQSESPEIQLIGLYLAKQMNIKPVLDRTGILSRLYLKLPPVTEEREPIDEEVPQHSEESEYLNFEGKIPKDQFDKFLGFSKSRNINGKERDPKKFVDKEADGFPLELILAGKVLRIQGYVLKESVDLITIQTGGSAALLDPIFKICRSKPTSWKTISKKKIETTVGYSKISSFQEVLKDLTKFSKYTSGVGLKGALRSLFIGKINDQTGIKIRIAIPIKDWNNLPTKKQEEVVNSLLEISSSRS